MKHKDKNFFFAPMSDDGKCYGLDKIQHRRLTIKQAREHALKMIHDNYYDSVKICEYTNTETVTKPFSLDEKAG